MPAPLQPPAEAGNGAFPLSVTMFLMVKPIANHNLTELFVACQQLIEWFELAQRGRAAARPRLFYAGRRAMPSGRVLRGFSMIRLWATRHSWSSRSALISGGEGDEYRAVFEQAPALPASEESEVFASPSRGSLTRSRGDALIWSSNFVVKWQVKRRGWEGDMPAMLQANGGPPDLLLMTPRRME
jgi:hypothetical protein